MLDDTHEIIYRTYFHPNVRKAIHKYCLQSHMDDKEQTLIESQVRDRLSVDGPDQRTRLDLGLIFCDYLIHVK